MPIPGPSGSGSGTDLTEEIGYVTREQVQDALHMISTARMDARIDQARLAASRDVEGHLHRTFYPWTGTRYFDQPTSGTLWLYENELTEITSVVSGSTTLTSADYIPRPQYGASYRWIDINYGGANFWTSDATPQNAVAITGTFGHPVVSRSVTTLSGSVSSSVTTLALASAVGVGTGSLLLAGSERMLVTRLSSATTGVTLAGDLTAAKGLTAVPVSDGTLIGVGERILIDSEAMAVEDIAGNTLIVERAARGTVLAAHTTGATIYAPRSATVSRGVLGTSAAAHADALAVYTLTAPSLVQELTMALTVNNIQQGLSGYSRPRGAGENRSDVTGRGVAEILEDAYTRYGRKARSRAVGA